MWGGVLGNCQGRANRFIACGSGVGGMLGEGTVLWSFWRLPRKKPSSGTLLLPVTSLSLLLPVCHLCPFSYCYGAESQMRWVCICPETFAGPLTVCWETCSFFCCPNPHWILQPEVIGTWLSGAGTLDWVGWSGLGLGLLTPEVSFLIFFYHP